MTGRRATAQKKASPKTRVVFTLEAPEAQQVHVTGSFCDWETNSCALKKGRTSVWRTTLSLPPGRHEYRFLVDGEWRDDPNCTERVPNPFGTENCVLHVLRESTQAARSAVASEEMP
jgi:1,4-alpha-glucan branching enzyme